MTGSVSRSKSAIRKKGVTPADLARSLKVSPQTVSGVIRGSITSETIATAIAKVTGLAPDVLWPQRYGQQSSPQQRVAALLAKPGATIKRRAA